MHCRVCTNPDVRVIDRINSRNCELPVPVCHCRKCGHFSLFPDQYQQQKAFDWDGVDYYLNDASHRKAVASQILDQLWNAYQQKNARLPRRFLDAGCAIGHSLPLAEARGLEAVGIEPEARIAAYGREELGVDIRIGMLGQVEFPDASFDLIFCEQVLEHVPDPAVFLALLKTLLAPGGQMYVGVPPVFPLNRFTTLLIRKLHWPLPDTVLSNIFHDPDEHISVFSRRSIQHLADGAGLELTVMPTAGLGSRLRSLSKRCLTMGASPGTYLMTPVKSG